MVSWWWLRRPRGRTSRRSGSRCASRWDNEQPHHEPRVHARASDIARAFSRVRKKTKTNQTNKAISRPFLPTLPSLNTIQDSHTGVDVVLVGTMHYNPAVREETGEGDTRAHHILPPPPLTQPPPSLSSLSLLKSRALFSRSLLLISIKKFNLCSPHTTSQLVVE